MWDGRLRSAREFRRGQVAHHLHVERSPGIDRGYPSGDWEQAGSLELGACFVRLGARAEGVLSLSPHTDPHLFLDGWTTWTVHSREPVDCASETYVVAPLRAGR